MSSRVSSTDQRIFLLIMIMIMIIMIMIMIIIIIIIIISRKQQSSRALRVLFLVLAIGRQTAVGVVVLAVAPAWIATRSLKAAKTCVHNTATLAATGLALRVPALTKPPTRHRH
jgi:hypothetical protein